MLRNSDTDMNHPTIDSRSPYLAAKSDLVARADCYGHLTRILEDYPELCAQQPPGGRQSLVVFANGFKDRFAFESYMQRLFTEQHFLNLDQSDSLDAKN